MADPAETWTQTAETWTQTAERGELIAEILRLRRRTHEIQTQADQRFAPMQRHYDRMCDLMRAASEYNNAHFGFRRGLDGAWQSGGGSMSAIDQAKIAKLLGEYDCLRSYVEQLAAALQGQQHAPGYAGVDGMCWCHYELDVAQGRPRPTGHAEHCLRNRELLKDAAHVLDETREPTRRQDA